MSTGTYPEAGRFGVSQPLSDDPYAEEVRTALGGTWRVPKVDEATLARYYQFLCEKLSFPFVAWYPESKNSREERDYCCTVVELIDPATGIGDPFDGIFCKVHKGGYEVTLPLIELELSPDSSNYWLVENYWYWFWHWR